MLNLIKDEIRGEGKRRREIEKLDKETEKLQAEKQKLIGDMSND